VKAFKGGFFGCFGVAAAILLVVVVAAAIASLGDDDESRVVSTPTAAEETAEGTPRETDQAGPHPIGTSVEVGDAVVTVVGFRTITSEDVLPPDPGFQYLVVDIQVRNVGDDAYSLSTLLQFKLRDSDARTYNVTFVPKLRGSLDVTIAPGDVARGEVAFEVPIDKAPYRFRFQQAFGSGLAEWLIQPQ